MIPNGHLNFECRCCLYSDRISNKWMPVVENRCNVVYCYAGGFVLTGTRCNVLAYFLVPVVTTTTLRHNFLPQQNPEWFDILVIALSWTLAVK